MKFYDFIPTEYDGNSKIIIYGESNFAIMASYCLEQLGISYFSYADEKGTQLPGVPIMSALDVAALCANEQVIVLLAMEREDFQISLEVMEKAGIKEAYYIWTLLDSVDFMKSDYGDAVKVFYLRRHDLYVYQEKVVNPQGLYIESVDATVTERCSLKCKDCSNLMQYYKCPKDLDVDELKESIDLLLDKVDRISQLRILGGEPFMHRDFVKIVDAYLEEDKIWEIAIFSNATIFPKEDILMHLKHKKVLMRMSDYGPLSRNMDKWITWCVENDVNYEVVKMDSWQDCGKLEKHDYSEGKLRAVYNTCVCRNIPTVLDNRLYNCPYAANAANLGAMDKKDAEKDGLLLSEEGLTKEKINQFLYERPYLEACRYCNGRNNEIASVEPFVQTKNPLEYVKRVDFEIEEEKAMLNEVVEDKKVSIVIPVYNVEKYAEKCLRSVMGQSYENLEIIVVNDGSTDGTSTICEALSKEDVRIIYINNGHHGVATTRNIGIEKSSGEYIMFIDADDWVDETYVESMIREMGENDAVIAGYISETEEKRDFRVGPDSQSKYRLLPLKEGVYKNDEIVEIWRAMFAPYNKNAFVPFLWRTLFKTCKMKEICKKLDTKIWFYEDTVLTNIYLSRSDSIKIVAVTGYHNLSRKNEGVNERYNFEGMLENVERVYWCKKRCFEGHPYEQMFDKLIDDELKSFVKDAIGKKYQLRKSFYFPYFGRLKEKRIVLYGAGDVGKSFRENFIEANEGKVVLWVDKVAHKYEGVSEVQCILETEYDYVVVAVIREKMYKEISEQLQAMGVPESKILWNRTREEW